MSLGRTGLLAGQVVQINPSLLRGLRACAFFGSDLLAFACATLLAFAIDISVKPDPLYRAYAQIARNGVAWHGWGTLLVLLGLLGYFAKRSHYVSRVPFWNEIAAVLVGIAFAFAADGVINLKFYEFSFGPEGMMRWVLFAPVLLAFRQITRMVLDLCGLWRIGTIVVGEPSAMECACSALRSEPALGYDVIATLNLKDLGNPEPAEWAMLLRSCGAEFVVVAVGEGDFSKQGVVITALARAGAQFAIVPTIDGLPVLGFNLQYFLGHDTLLLVCRNNLARPLVRAAKVLFDTIIAALALVLLSPLLVVIASLVRADGGPALFAHKRIGLGGQTFKCLKFRTMVTHAEEALRELLLSDAAARAEWSATQKLSDDPRVTRIGKFLRKTSLDELPQLLNVLRGEMSLVGPRPIVESEITRYGRDIDYYFDTRPGITGLWQVSGRSETSYARRIQLDLWYVKNWTLWHDVTILLKTIPAVLRKDGAV